MKTSSYLRIIIQLSFLFLAFNLAACGGGGGDSGNAAGSSSGITGNVPGSTCIADLSQWKLKYTTSALSCTQCHTTPTTSRHGTVGGAWKYTNCSECHEGPHGSVSDD